ncbi:MAG: hypothetical protein LBJ13_03210 [Puniceicoccales bacterium]|jgi:membrane-associated phospholipid phosphatase|nr:hypothetical protein [Puniceicoccales bacterium]
MGAITYKIGLAVLLSCVVMLLAFIDNAWHEQEVFVIVGNFLRIIIPCVGCYISLAREDKIGIKQFFYTILVTILITYAIKWATYRMDIGIRPSGGTKSFPSGHASCSFQGAFFLSKRYGWKLGIPALAFASLAIAVFMADITTGEISL